MSHPWPADNEAALIAFYGHPGAEVERQMVTVIPPFRMTYQGKPVHEIKFHKKAAAALLAALVEIWEFYGKDQAKIDALRVSHYDGAYNPRKIAGSSRWSNHAFACAIDLDGDHNGFNTGHGTIPKPVIAAFKRQGARWGGDYKHRTDPMHFEFCGPGEQVASLPPAATVPDAPKAPILFTATGRMSTFGGPDDTGVKASEGLALFNDREDMEKHGLGDWLMPPAEAGAAGLARRLRPEKHYIAARWRYDETPKALLQKATVTVRNERTGKSVDGVRPVDWGPHVRTGRVCDLSPGLAEALELKTDDMCRVTLFADQRAIKS